MPRAADGTMTLPAGNPVVAGTTASATVHNNTLEDIRAELQDSLSRSGKGGMTAPLPLPDGSAASPAASFTSDTDTGLYRIGADNLGVSIGGVKVADLAASLMQWISRVTDGASAVAHAFDTVVSLSNASAKLASWRNGNGLRRQFLRLFKTCNRCRTDTF